MRVYKGVEVGCEKRSQCNYSKDNRVKRGHVYDLYTVLKIGKEKPKLTGKVGTDTQYFVNSKIESKSKHKSIIDELDN